MAKQGWPPLLLAPCRLPPPKFLPGIERRIGVDLLRRPHRMLDDREHFVDFVVDRFVRVFGKPFRRQVVGGDAGRILAVDADTQPNKGMRRLRHGDDAVFERHARLHVEKMNIAVMDSNVHRSSCFGRKISHDHASRLWECKRKRNAKNCRRMARTGDVATAAVSC
ncbi:MAG: hypothetical protein KatS3mg105_0463 [Gemmatales bacterium]|nr:MAG: hypothetical protein KatS3mg105_0463 [Gemmatales bacterium]